MNARWRERLVFAVTRLGLSPDAFWALTLAEWRALAAPAPGAAPLGRAELQALLDAAPDLVRPGETP